MIPMLRVFSSGILSDISISFGRSPGRKKAHAGPCPASACARLAFYVVGVSMDVLLEGGRES
jgi:hypothetical protein